MIYYYSIILFSILNTLSILTLKYIDVLVFTIYHGKLAVYSIKSV